VAALSAGFGRGAGRVGENVLVDTYQGLKEILKRKFGDDSEVVEVVDKLEKKPDSEGRKGTLKEELEDAGVDQDPDVCRVAQELLEQLKAPGGETHIQNAIGSYIAQADHGSTATVNVD
jgi:hypothetical protein